MASEAQPINLEELKRLAAYLAKVEVSAIQTLRVDTDQTVIVLLVTGHKYRFTPDQIKIVRDRFAAQALAEAAAKKARPTSKK